MAIDSGPTDFRYIGEDPFSDRKSELKLGPDGARFTLPREKRKRKYTVVYDVEWANVISYECCSVHICKDGLSWPFDEELPKGYNPIGKSGMLFIYLRMPNNKYFQVWGFFPEEDVEHVQDLIQQCLGRVSLTGLAHHATAAPVRYIVNHCNVLSQFETKWSDWLHTRSSVKPREHLRERGPNYIFCKEGMAVDFYGAGEQLEQMSTFWPWRVINQIFIVDVEIFYQWFEDAYTFQQQVFDHEERQRIYTAAKNALESYNSSEDVEEYLLIRPWSFPSRFHRTWDKLAPFASKASRHGFPPITDFIEEEEPEDGSLI